jgi:alpha-mannosidase
MRAVTSQLHAGQIPAHASFLSLDPMELCLTSMKSSEEGDGLIVRIVNLSDQSGHANIKTLLPLSAAWQVRLDESPLSQLGIRDSHQLQVIYHPYEILSLRLEF